MVRNHFRIALLSSATALTGISAAPAFAQDQPVVQQRSGISEIVVTARKREESLQDTPLAITAVDSSVIESRNIENFIDISKITPNLKIHETPGGLGAAAIFLRGISYGDNIIGNDAPIGFYIDGVAYGRISTAGMDLVEPDSVQVLRGPQGTLFGRNTTGGAIVVETHTPTDDFSGVVRGSYGSFNATSLRARIDTGYIGDSTVKASFAYSHRKRDGIQDNVGVPSHLDPGAIENEGYWGKIVGEFGNLKVTASADYTKLGGVPVQIQAVDGTASWLAYLANSPNYGGNAVPVTQEPLFRVENYATPLPQRITQKGVQLTLEYALDDHLTAKAIGAARGYRRDDTNNYGASDLRGPTTSGQVRSFAGWYGFLERFQKQSQKSLELQFLGDYDQINFVGGLYYFDEDARDFGTTRLPFVLSPNLAFDSISYRDYSVASKSKAAYAQVDYRPGFLEGLELSAGVRYTDDKRDFVQVQPLPRELPLKGDNWSYQLSANYQFTDGLMGYVRYSTGYRAGGFNARTTSASVSPIYEPEKIKAWEAGFKLDALDRRLRLNVAAFFNKYNNLQTTQFAPPDQSGSGSNININANAEYKGVEVEVTLVPVDGLNITGSYGYVDSQYKKYPQPLLAGGAVIPGCSAITDSSGAAILQDCAAVQLFQNQPDSQWDIDATYTFPPTDFGEVSLSVNYSWRGETPGVYNRNNTNYPFSLDNPDYGLLGARFAISDIPINGDVKGTIAIFGNNLTDRRYSNASIDFGFAGTKNFPDRRSMGIEAKVAF